MSFGYGYKLYIVLENLYAHLSDKVDFFFDTPVNSVTVLENEVCGKIAEESFSCEKCIISVGRSGSKWMERICNELEIPTKSNRVDLGVRVELPAEVFFLILPMSFNGDKSYTAP